MSDSVWALTLATALGCGLAAGVFFSFSAFVMEGLARLPTGQGISAMQSINRTAVRPPLLIALFGTAVLCLGLAVWALTSSGGRPGAWLLAGGGLYLVGVIGVTIGLNVPLNDELAALDPESAEA